MDCFRSPCRAVNACKTSQQTNSQRHNQTSKSTNKYTSEHTSKETSKHSNKQANTKQIYKQTKSLQNTGEAAPDLGEPGGDAAPDLRRNKRSNWKVVAVKRQSITSYNQEEQRVKLSLLLPWAKASQVPCIVCSATPYLNTPPRSSTIVQKQSLSLVQFTDLHESIQSSIVAQVCWDMSRHATVK